MICYFCEKPIELEMIIALDARPNATTESLCHQCGLKLDRFIAFMKSLYSLYEEHEK